jgi:hypothetical protein
MELRQSEALGMLVTITVAAGTSTPTSITVVATRTDRRPSANAAIVASRSAPFSRPYSSPTLPGKRALNCPKRSSTLARSTSSDSSISGHTQ